MISRHWQLIMLIFTVAASSCGPKPKDGSNKVAPADETGALLRVGTITILQSDLDHHLKEKHDGRGDDATREQALAELAGRARLVQAALDADLDRDPVVRAAIARALSSRFKEQSLFPKLKDIAAPVPESRLRELYAAGESRFRSGEKRQVAVLWLDPKGNPEREKQYQDKLAAARDWLFKNGDLKDHPEQGFSVLGVDHSEHPASRYKGGVVGWLEREGGMDPWTKAVAGIAFSLEKPGEVTSVITRSEGVFLVRYMAKQAAVLRPFEAVSGELERAERQRLRDEAEAAFEAGIGAKYPVQVLTSPER